MGQDIDVESGDGAVPVHVAEPEGEARGAVVVLQEAFGVNDHIRDVAGRLAASGYVAAAPHLFHRSGDPQLGYDDLQQVMPHIMELRAADIDADIDATLEHLARLGFDPPRVGVVGFCMGGTISFTTACSRALGAAVTFYGGGVAQGRFGFPSLIELAPSLQTPWLGLFGDLDAGIPIDDVDALTAAVATSAPPTEVVRYPDADHGFHCDARSSYHEISATDAWRRTLAFFDQHLA
jgi:carboxymethylenebutenolidase